MFSLLLNLIAFPFYIVREPSTESDYLKQAITTNFSLKNNAARPNASNENAKTQNNGLPGPNKVVASSLPRIDQFVAPSSPGQIRLAKESAAVKSLTLSRIQDKVKDRLLTSNLFLFIIFPSKTFIQIIWPHLNFRTMTE